MFVRRGKAGGRVLFGFFFWLSFRLVIDGFVFEFVWVLVVKFLYDLFDSFM